MKLYLSVFLLMCTFAVSAQRNADVLHYRFEVSLSDSTDLIEGKATIRSKMNQPTNEMVLDLVNESGGKGMKVTNVTYGGQPLTWKHENNLLSIQLSSTASRVKELELVVSYRGVPADGLIISQNKYGDRTFFSDNWPNRAKNWLPCVDHPGDKASVEFLVTAPSKYQVVSNGMQIEESNLDNDRKLTHWKENTPLPTKIMVIGAARFAVQYVGDTLGVPVYSWVYPQDRNAGFYDYAPAKDILPFFIKNIAPFAYPKLANVQSKTMFGGMENAGCIFYAENSVNGRRSVMPTLVHEIAHQWFGNMATETSFAHVWLSEGFATYFTNLYTLEKYGQDSMNMRMAEDRNDVINFSKEVQRSIVDTTTTNYMELLNANSYQKGGWVLHMLRELVGPDVFMKGVRAYYQKYQGANASTDDFRQVMEQVSGKDLKNFFQQWLYTEGHPVFKVRYENAGKNTILTVSQKQKTLFTFPMEVLFVSDNKEVKRTFQIKNKEERIVVQGVSGVTRIEVDPGTKLLYEITF